MNKINPKKVNKKAAKKEIRYTPKGRIYLTATFNNTIITITDDAGKVLFWNSCGKSGFTGTRKSTPFAATSVIEKTLISANELFGFNEASVYIKGAGPGRESLLRVLRNSKIDVNKLVDVTPIPHDGIRPKKPRRV